MYAQYPIIAGQFPSAHEPCEECGRICECHRAVVLPLASGHEDDSKLLQMAPATEKERDDKRLAKEFAKFLYESTPATFYREMKIALGHSEEHEEHWE